MRTLAMKLLFGRDWGMVRRKADGSLEVIHKPYPTPVPEFRRAWRER